jgi:hypothetical protein
MAFKPMKDDEEFNKLLDDLSQVSEECALAATAVNRANSANRASRSLERACEDANRRRREVKKSLRALLNARISSAYNAGIDDGQKRDL